MQLLKGELVIGRKSIAVFHLIPMNSRNLLFKVKDHLRLLGGIGNLAGAVLGAILIGLIQGLNDGLPIGLGQQWSQTVVFSILILLMVFKPTGLLGKPMTEKV